MAVLEKYPQVIDFSGHSHYAANDPRSIRQGRFTTVNTGSTCAQMSNLNYLGTEDAPGDTGVCWIVEVDADGNTRLQLLDLANHRFFEKNEYYLTDITNPTAHRYTWGNLKSLDTAPEFGEEAEIIAEAEVAAESGMPISTAQAAAQREL